MKASTIVVILAALAVSAAAHGGSGNRNCQWGGWSGYSGCTSTFDPVSGSSSAGTQTRSRGIRVTRRGGGASCTGPSVQTRQCSGCQLSQWTGFGGCPDPSEKSGGTGTRVRTRHIIANPTNGGPGCNGITFNAQGFQEDRAECAHCEWHWSEWSICDGTRRQRSVVVDKQPANGGKACPTEGESELCTNCDATEWSAFTSCTSGKQKRTRRVIVEASANGVQCAAKAGSIETEEVLCEECATTEWQEWSVCKTTTNGRDKIRSKRVIGTPSPGVKCEVIEEACSSSADCQPKCAPEADQDCTYVMDGTSPKIVRSDTTVACTTGTDHFDILQIDIEPKGGGKKCKGALVTCDKQENGCEIKVSKTCTLPEKDCELTAWSEYEPAECVSTINGKTVYASKRVRSKEIKTRESNGGSCPKDTDPERLEEELCVYDCVMGEWQPWSECEFSDSTGEFQQTRKREKEMNETAGGSCPEENDVEETRLCTQAITGLSEDDYVSNEDKDIVDMGNDEVNADWFNEEVSAEGATKGQVTLGAGAGGTVLISGVAVLAFRRNVKRTEDDDDEEEDEEESSDTELTKEVEMSDAQALGEGWTASQDPNTGKLYYFHRERGTSTWDRSEATA